MNSSNESMVVVGLDKNNNNLNALKSNSSVTNLEIKQLTLKDNWALLSELKQLRSLTVKDSFVDFKKFYSAICTLPKLEQLTYNHYCFFNKDKKDILPGNLKLPSLKIFKLEFPDESEPNFEISTYGQESYKIKHNSITELKDSHKIFPNLEEIQFVNYQTYRKRMEDEYANNKKLNSSVYWNMNAAGLISDRDITCAFANSYFSLVIPNNYHRAKCKMPSTLYDLGNPRYLHHTFSST